jgi:hypothetical protein
VDSSVGVDVADAGVDNDVVNDYDDDDDGGDDDDDADDSW